MALPRHELLTAAITFTVAGLLLLVHPVLGIIAAMAAILRILISSSRRH